MGLSASMIDAMVSAGCTAEQLAAVIKADIAEREGVANERRARDAERQRRHRMSRDVTVTECDIDGHGVTPPFPSPSFPPDPPNTPSHTRPSNNTRARKDSFPAPTGVSDEQWSGFLDQRKKRVTARAYGLLCNKLEVLARDGWPPGDMIDLATERGWETVFKPKEFESGRFKRQGCPSGGKATDGWQSVLRDVANRQADSGPSDHGQGMRGSPEMGRISVIR